MRGNAFSDRLIDALALHDADRAAPAQRYYQRPRLRSDALMQPSDLPPPSEGQVGGYLIDRSLQRHADQEAQRRAQINQRNGNGPDANDPTRNNPVNIARDVGNMVFEGTGLPAARRAIQHTYNSMQMGVGDDSNAEAQAGTMDALGAALNAGLMFGPGMVEGMLPKPAAPLPPMRAYRGLRSEWQPGGSGQMPAEFWTASPDLASAYASDLFPNAEAPNVVPGLIDTNKYLQVNANGRTWDNLPITGIQDAHIRRMFPRQDSSRGPTARQLTQYAEDRGYHGVVFRDMLDHPFGSEADPNVAKPHTVFSVINRASRRSAFNGVSLDETALPGMAELPRARGVARLSDPSPSLLPPPRQLGYTPQGGLLPIRPTEPFRTSLRGGSDDLREALRQQRPDISAPDAGASPTRRIYRGTPNATTQWRQSRHGRDDEHILGEGLYVTTDRGVASQYGPHIHEADVSGRLLPEANWHRRVLDAARRAGVSDTDRAGWTRVERNVRRELIANGYVGIEADPSHTGAEMVVWPETNALRPVKPAPEAGVRPVDTASASPSESQLPPPRKPRGPR